MSAVRDAAGPPVADRAVFQTELDRLRVREKAHTREGDAVAAARRRLPMVEVDPQTPLVGADGRGDEVMSPSYGLLDRTVYCRQEFWEDSPGGWPQRWGSQGGQFQLNGRPAAQWQRIQAGRDDLGPLPDGWTACTCPLHTAPPAAATN